MVSCNYYDERYSSCIKNECVKCSCGGDGRKCIFYPEKDEEVEKPMMNIAEMWIKAQQDWKVYECINGDMAYSKATGLVDKNDFDKTWELASWDYKGTKALDDLLGGSAWKEMKIMTKKDAEKQLGVKIID